MARRGKRLMNQGCPFRVDSCEVDGIDGAEKVWCCGDACPIPYADTGVRTGELWGAYKDHKIRFGIDDYGNQRTEIVDTGEKIAPDKFTRSDLERATHPKMPHKPNSRRARIRRV